MPVLTVNQNGNAFPRFEANSVQYLGNFFNPFANANSGVGYDWSIPLADESDPCNSDVQGSCIMTFRGNGDNNNPPFGYPAAVVGSLGGRFETLGVQCGNSQILGGMRDATGSPSPVYDLEIPRRALGLPNLISDMPTVEIFGSTTPLTSINPNANVFLDSYWYDLDQNPPLPQYAGTINAINATCNRMWNFNVWFDHPFREFIWDARQSGDNDLENRLITRYTGGRVIGEITLAANRYKLVEKYEDGGNNNFFYVALVLVEQNGAEPDPESFHLNYDLVKEFALSDEFWALVRTSPIIQQMANPEGTRKPIIVRRPALNMGIDAIALGREYWGNPVGTDETRSRWNTLRFVIDGSLSLGKGALFDAPTIGCELPIRYTGGSVAQCPISIRYRGNFSCTLPIQYSASIRKIDALCDQCPSYGQVPKVLAPYGSNGFEFNLENFVNFPAGSNRQLDDARIIGLDGDVQIDTGRGTARYLPPLEGDCVNCGRFRVSFRYICPTPRVVDTDEPEDDLGDTLVDDGSTFTNFLLPIAGQAIDLSEEPQLGAALDEPEQGQLLGGLLNIFGLGGDGLQIQEPEQPSFVVVAVDDALEDSNQGINLENDSSETVVVNPRIQICTLEFEICSFPAVEQLSDECIRLAPGATSITLEVVDTEVGEGLEVIDGIADHCARIVWDDDGYLWSVPAGVFGKFRAIVPTYPTGDRARQAKRCVDIIIPPDRKRTRLPECCKTVLMVREACIDGDVWRPIAELRDINLQFTEERPDDFVDYETCQTVIARAQSINWSMSGTIVMGLHDYTLQTGCDYEIRLIFDIFNPDDASFDGTARSSANSISLSNQTEPVDKNRTFSLNGHGSFCAKGFVI